MLTRRTLLEALSLAPLGGWAARAGAQALPDLGFVAPELRPAAAATLRRTAAEPAYTAALLPGIRRQRAAAAAPPADGPAVTRRRVPGAAGQPEVTVYVVNARPGAARPAILHTHGGGYILGSAADSLPSLQRTAAALDCVIVTVDYRLAPETDWRGSVADNYAGLRWLHANAEALGVDRARIAVMGESAGGGHAALLAIAARDKGEVPLAAQILVYPMLDDRTGTVSTPPAPIGTILWTPARNRLGWGAFLGQVPGTAAVPAAAVPARVADLRGLPPTWIGVGAIDLFVDEDLAYARRLIDAQVPTELLVVPGAFHAFDGLAADTIPARRFTPAKLDALRRAFTPPG